MLRRIVSAIILTGVLIGVLTFGASIKLMGVSSESQAYPEVKQLTKDDVEDRLFPHAHAISGDGSTVTFNKRYSAYDARIYVMNTTDESGEEKMLTAGLGYSSGSSISADGSKIAFHSSPYDHDILSYEIFIINTTDDPGDEIRITENVGMLDVDVDISGNGEMIAWESGASTTTGIHIVVANISDLNNVETRRFDYISSDNYEYPSLTYDGELLSFWDESNGEVFLINSDGTGLKDLTNSAEYEMSRHEISGDGSKVAFTRMVASDYEIFVYDITHDTLIQLSDNNEDDVLGGINHDGTIITYSRDGHLFLHNMTTETQLTDGNFNDQRPRISGDGSVIVFQSDRDGPDNDIFMIRLREQISASVDIDPDTLNLKSNGQWITAYISLPGEYRIDDIVPETVRIADNPLVWSEIQDGVFMAKFDRASVQAALTDETDYEIASKFYYLTLTVTGELSDGTQFEGTDTIRVIMR